MAVEYQTGTATSMVDLLQKFYTFATSVCGWTAVDNTGPATGNHGTQHSIKSPDVDIYVHMVANNTFGNLEVQLATGYTASAEYLAHTGSASTNSHNSNHIRLRRAIEAGDGDASGWQNYHFFGSSDPSENYLYLTLEISAGRFRHFMCGMPCKIDNYVDPATGFFADATTLIPNGGADTHFPFQTGGASVEGGAWMKVPEDSILPLSVQLPGVDNGGPWGAPDSGWTDAIGFLKKADNDDDALGFQSPQYFGGRHTASGRPQMAPIYMKYGNHRATPNPSADDLWIFMGSPRNIAWVSMDGLNAGDSITVGGETWLAFPMIEKSIPATFPYRIFTANDNDSGLHGLAFRQS